MNNQPTRRERRAAMQALTAQNRYDAAGSGRRMQGWNPPSTGPRRATEGTSRLRDRSQDAVRNDWAGAGLVQKWASTLIGFGITPRWASEVCADVWREFVPRADADGVLDAYGLQALAVRSWFSAGEVFMRRRRRPMDGSFAVPVQVQLIESDYCPVFDSDQWPGMASGNVIRQGIELNKYNDRVAYWFHKEHPGDGMRGINMGTTDLIRVPVDEVSHVFEPKRPGQLRGVSELAPILARLRSSGDFEDAVLERQKLANLFTVFFRKPLPTDWNNLKVDPNTGMPVEWNNKGQAMTGLEPGMAVDLLPGEDVQFSNPPEAGVSISDYLRTLGLGTAAGGGMPYEIMSGDIRDIGDRTLRVLIQEFRRFATQRQWHVVIPMICQPMVRWAGQAALLKGSLSAATHAEFCRPEWSPQGWDYIHPVQDVQGKKIAIEAGITSRSAVIAERGDDPRQVQAQREADRKDDEARGLVDTQQGPGPTARSSLLSSRGPRATGPAGHPGDPLAVVQSITGQLVDALKSLGIAAAARPIEIQNNVDVPPAAVTVNMPDRVSSTVVEHDEDGNLIGSITTERTVQ